MRVQETRVKKANNDDLKVSEVIDALENAVQVVFNDYMDFVSITKKTHSSNCIEFFVNLDARKAGGSSSKYTAEVNTGRRTFEISAADDDRDDFVGGKDEIEKDTRQYAKDLYRYVKDDLKKIDKYLKQN